MNGAVVLAAKDATHIESLPPTFAVIARVGNHTAAPISVFLDVNGVPACAFQVAGGGTTRVDCAVTGVSTPERRWTVATVRGPAAGWTLDYLEFATHHGASSIGAKQLVVLPAGSRAFVPASAGTEVVVWLLLTAVLGWRPLRQSRVFRVCVERVATPVLFGFALLIWLMPRVSPYTLIVPVAGTMAVLGLLLVPRVYGWAEQPVRRYFASRGPLRSTVAGLLAGVFVLSAYWLVVDRRVHEDYQGNYSGLLQLSQRRFDQHPMLRDRADIRRTLVLRADDGYDGQFAYYATFDPFLRDYRDDPSIYGRFIDAPPYRFGRIGLSLLTKLASANQPLYFPQAMIGVVMASLFAAGLLLARIARDDGDASSLAGALVVLVPGFWQSVQCGLPEPTAAALLLGGYLCVRRQQWIFAGLLFSLALMVRETSAIFLACLAVWTLHAGRRRDVLTLTAIAVLPWAAWKLYVGWALYPDWGIHGFVFNPRNMGPPLGGIIALWNAIAHGSYYPGVSAMHRAGIWYPILVMAGSITAIVVCLRKPGPVTVAAVIYGAIALCLNYESIWVHVWNGQRGTYELFVMLALATIGHHRYPRTVVALLVLFWVGAGAYILFGAPDAEFVRNTLTPL